MSAFRIETLSPHTGVYPKLIGPYGVVLPVSPHDPSKWQQVVHAISHENYSLTRFSFKGTFEGTVDGMPVAPNSLDEEAVFVCSDIVKFDGQEFGFRLSLKDNVLYGYVQDGTNKVTQGKTFFKNIRLMAGDGRLHVYEAQARSEGHTNTFTWLVDGEVMETYTYDSELPFTSLRYHVVATTHRKEDGWSSDGLQLTVENILLN